MLRQNFRLGFGGVREVVDQHLGDALVQQPAAALEQAVIGGVTHEGVLELERLPLGAAAAVHEL